MLSKPINEEQVKNIRQKLREARKAKKEGKKGKSRKSILKTLRLIENNNKLLQKYKEELGK